MAHVKNRNLGRGRVLVSEVDPITNRVSGYKEILLAKDFTVAVSGDRLPGYDYTVRGRPKDASVLISREYTASFGTESMDDFNVGLFFGSDAEDVTQAALASVTGTINAVLPGLTYFIGENEANQTGLKHLTSAAFTVGGTALDEDEDYTIDLVNGAVTFLAGGAVVSGGNVGYTVSAPARTYKRVVSASEEKTLAMKFITDNEVGENRVYKFPRVILSPNDGFVLQSDAWSAPTFNAEILRFGAQHEIYCDGYPLEI